MSNWDDEDFEPPAPRPASDDRWAGEDEDKVKDNWDDDEEEEKKAAAAATAPVAQAKKKTKKQIIAEKEAQKQAELKAKRAEMERLNAVMTPEEKLAEKMRIQKQQEESDLQFAVDMMGIKESDGDIFNLKDADINSAEGLEALSTAIVNKVRNTDRLQERSFYVPFLEKFFKDLCLNLESDEVKKVTSVLNALYNDKVKASKPVKGKKKAAGKAKLHVGKDGGSNFMDDFDMVSDRYDGDFDDFM